MKALCKHIYLSGSMCCLKCAQFVEDTDRYQYNTEINMYVKKVYEDKQVKALETLVEEGKVLLFLDIDETILHTTLNVDELGATTPVETISIDEFVNNNFVVDDESYYTNMKKYRVFWFMIGGSKYYFLIRPGFIDFVLKTLGKIVVFLTTTSKRSYALTISRFFDPHSRLIHQLTSREGQETQAVESLSDDSSNEYAKSIKFIAKSKILREKHIILDDRPSAWDAPNPPHNFIRSVPFGVPMFLNGDCYPMLPCGIRENYIAPQMEFAQADFEIEMVRLKEIVDLVNAGIEVKEQRRETFKNCVFFFILNEQKEVVKTEENGMLRKLQHEEGDAFRTDVRIEAVWDHGGSVSLELSENVTHVVTSSNMGNPPAGNFKVVGSAFIFWSCCMLQRGREEDFQP